MRWDLIPTAAPCRPASARFKSIRSAVLGIAVALSAAASGAEKQLLESQAMRVEIDPHSGAWSLVDKSSGVRWPSEGAAGAGTAGGLPTDFAKVEASQRLVRLEGAGGAAVNFELVNEGRSLEIRYQGDSVGDVRVLDDALAVTAAEEGYAVVPCREGLLIPANSGAAFSQTFGTSDYEGCHMNMIGLVKRGAAIVVSWDDAYVFAELKSVLQTGDGGAQRLTAGFNLRRSARAIRLTPLGQGDWNTLAAAYRRIADQKGLAVTLRAKIERNPHVELMLGAVDFKLWTCLARRMNEESTAEESVRVRWTFDEAAAIAEHLHDDLGVRRCLFMIGGWTAGGYDCRHPDNLPANPECGGNDALADAVQRIQKLGFVASLHDNYQDMYRDAPSWDPAVIEKKPDGSLVAGGRWLGGRAYMVCAPKQVEMAMRPQNLPEIRRLFDPWSYFIDTTYAVGPRECFDPAHPIGRNDDIAWKIRLSDEARKMFGIFGSECGREWALPHSDFFEGLVGVSGKHYHNLDPARLGATVIPFWEMVYHDCQICWGKYGYSADEAAPFVAHHTLCARPLYYHSVPDHLYWHEKTPEGERPSGDRAGYARTDQGWAAGLHPLDAFLKNTQELLGPLHAATAFDRLSRLEFLTPDRSVRRAQYGEGQEATTVVVNFGEGDAAVTTTLGGEVLLPPWGLAIEGPRFAAFYAKKWGGRDYPGGALFTLQPVEGGSLGAAGKLRVFHGFGEPHITWKGVDYEVAREKVIAPGDGSAYLEAARRFADTVLEHGRDTYGEEKTPLFVDGLEVSTLKPACWQKQGETWVLCNFASQQPLMRLLDGLTGLVGEPKYRRAAEDAARCALERMQGPNGLLSWGGHLAWDLQRDKSVGQYADTHELKNHQPYYQLMDRVDPQATARLMAAVWAGHILDWSRLDYNRHASIKKDVRPQWDHPFEENIEVPFPTAGGNLSFCNVTPPLLHASTMLAVLHDSPEAIVWARRLAWRWQQGRDPKTGLCGGQLSYRTQDRAQEALGHVHPTINEAKIVASYHQDSRYHHLPLVQMQAAEELPAAGDAGAKLAEDLIRWASEDLKTYARECYDAKAGHFVARMTDGTPLKWKEAKTGYYVPESFAPRPPDGMLFWSYAMAFRITADPSHKQMVDELGGRLGVWKTGGIDCPAEPMENSDWRMIYGLLEMHRATGEAGYLRLARRVGDNLLKLQAPSGLFPRKGYEYGRTGDEIPLALLHLAAAISGKRDQIPRAIFDSRFFHCEYDGKLEEHQKKRADDRTYDHLVFYGES